METQDRNPHLSDEDLFRLALPATGDPEALPPHLLQCSACGRALQEWKGAARDLAEQDEAALARRPAEDWLAAEEATLAAIRRSGRPGSRRRALPWALALAASLLLAVLLVTERARQAEPLILDDAAELSAEDSADDRLLREVAVLARGEEAGDVWNSLAPLPETDGLTEGAEEESL